MAIDNPRAFPLAYDEDQPVNGGMTLRDYFAAQVIAALAGTSYPGATAQVLARAAYEAADAMLAERAKRND